MKKILLLCLILFSYCFVFSQDTIVKRNGEKLVVKIIEVNTDNIRYKRVDYPEGPLFMLLKQDINFVVYGNGSKESFENYLPPSLPKPNLQPIDLTIQPSGRYYYYKEHRIAERDMLAVTSKQNNKQIDLMIKSVEQKRFIKNACLIGGFIFLAAGGVTILRNEPRRKRGGGRQPASASQLQGQRNGEYIMLGGLACEMASVYFTINKRKQAHLLVDAYNRNLYMK